VSETRIDRHDQNLIHVLQNFLQHPRRCCRLDDHANALAERLHALHGAMQLASERETNRSRPRRIPRGTSPDPISSSASPRPAASPAEVTRGSAVPSKDSARSARPSHQHGSNRLRPAPPQLLAGPGAQNQPRGWKGQVSRHVSPYPKSLLVTMLRPLTWSGPVSRFPCDSPIMACLGVGRLEDTLNGCIQPGVELSIGLLGRQPLYQRSRKARHDAVIPAQAVVGFFPCIAP